jgi:site-specific DNA-methyltransferase (adenine-specific)
MENIINRDFEWNWSSKKDSSPLHTLCSYMAMFPPTMPRYFIKRFSNEGDIVLDPFCGRGTTPLEACMQNRIGIGNDKNILAYILTSAKLNILKKEKIISRLNELSEEFDENSIYTDNESKDIKMLFNKKTLKQLVYLKTQLDWKNNKIDTFIAAMTLGILHGGSEGFLSIQMPNTFSMSPNYIRTFVHEHSLKKPKREVFQLLAKKLERCYDVPKIPGKVYLGDARKLSRIGDNSIDLIVTSPPYARLITYGKFNWIRLWFLDKTYREVDKKLFVTQSLGMYTNFMSEAINEFKRVIKPGHKIVLIIGDVKDKNNNLINLAKLVWEKSAMPLGLNKIDEIKEDIVKKGLKVSRIWGNKRLIVIDKSDRILILEKPQ